MTEDPFYKWSISEAWAWLINVHYLGFGAMVLCGLIIAVVWLAIVQVGQERAHR